MNILVTGGAGYIGSHTCLALIAAGHQPVIFDNFSNSNPEVTKRLEQICGINIPLIEGDITNRNHLDAAFNRYAFDAVMHFAGLKAVGESSQIPLHYYQNNVGGTLMLLQAMAAANVRHFIFSSSATVYGDPVKVPITEDMPTSTTNPYGHSKLMVEDILRDLCRAPKNPWRVTLLRYFNPIGAHESGLIGEDPKGIPNNLLPYVAQVAIGKLPELQVFGNDYPTMDGTGVRDYIHVVDLAEGHVCALTRLKSSDPGCFTYNLGTGRGYSVLEIVAAFERASSRSVPYRVCPRRQGDIAECYADPSLAKRELNWRATRELQTMMADAWRWQANNPNGFN